MSFDTSLLLRVKGGGVKDNFGTQGSRGLNLGYGSIISRLVYTHRFGWLT